MIELNKIYHGDMFDYLPHVQDNSIRMIFADFPYKTTKAKWDKKIDLQLFWKHANRILLKNGVVICTCQFPFTAELAMSNIKNLRYDWVWEKTTATGHFNAKKMPMKAHENVLVFYNKTPLYNPQKTVGHKPVNSFTKYVETQNKTELYGKVKKEISGGGETDRFPRSVQVFASDKQKIKLHSTQKPLLLNEYFIKTYSNEGDVVADFCCGSGSFGKAAQNLNRNFILVEEDEKIYNDAKNWLNL